MILRAFTFFLLGLSVLAFIAGCSSRPTAPSGAKKGGYYQDDGPGSDIPKNLHAIPNATPRIEQHAPANMRPYTVLGQRYTPVAANKPFAEKGNASWYGKQFHGRKTANGETYDMYAMTAAHPTLPLPSYAKVTRLKTGQSVIVRINDRGPFHSNRIIDLSYVAAAKLDLIHPGSDAVQVEAITHEDIRSGLYIAEKSKESKESKEVVSENTGLPRIFLQFGAFRNAQSATQLAEHLNKKLANLEQHDAEIAPSNALFRVQMGPYASRAEATEAAQMIEMQTGMQATLAVR